jgi:hypothetical protein
MIAGLDIPNFTNNSGREIDSMGEGVYRGVANDFDKMFVAHFF